MPTLMLIMNGISLLIVWVGANGIDNGTMQVGNMMAFIQYTMQIVMSFFNDINGINNATKSICISKSYK